MVVNESQRCQEFVLIFMFVQRDTELVKARGLFKKRNGGVMITVYQLAL